MTCSPSLISTVTPAGNRWSIRSRACCGTSGSSRTNRPMSRTHRSSPCRSRVSPGATSSVKCAEAGSEGGRDNIRLLTLLNTLDLSMTIKHQRNHSCIIHFSLVRTHQPISEFLFDLITQFISFTQFFQNPLKQPKYFFQYHQTIPLFIQSPQLHIHNLTIIINSSFQNFTKLL